MAGQPPRAAGSPKTCVLAKARASDQRWTEGSEERREDFKVKPRLMGVLYLLGLHAGTARRILLARYRPRLSALRPPRAWPGIATGAREPWRPSPERACA